MIPPTPAILPPVPSVSVPRSNDPTRVANGFESLFLSMLLKPLDESEAFFGTGAAGRSFSGLFRQQLADSLAVSRPLGIADRIEAVLRRQAAESYGKVQA